MSYSLHTGGCLVANDFSQGFPPVSGSCAGSLGDFINNHHVDVVTFVDRFHQAFHLQTIVVDDVNVRILFEQFQPPLSGTVEYNRR